MTMTADTASPASPAFAQAGSVPGVTSFRDRGFLLGHVQDTLRFYAPNVLDASGGFFHYFRDDGSIYNAHSRHLVSSCRFVFNYAMAYREFGDPQHLEYARHGVPTERLHRLPLFLYNRTH